MEKQKIENILNTRGQYVGLTMGTSMAPLLRTHKNTVVIRPREPKKYDVALYKRSSDGAYILHRVLEKSGGVYTIRGDNCLNKECNISRSQILGVMTEFYRGDRHIFCDSAGFKIYSRLAVICHPLVRVRCLAGRIRRKLKK